jgi:hypothetical protein
VFCTTFGYSNMVCVIGHKEGSINIPGTNKPVSCCELVFVLVATQTTELPACEILGHAAGGTVETRCTNLICSWRPFVNQNVRKPKLFFPSESMQNGLIHPWTPGDCLLKLYYSTLYTNSYTKPMKTTKSNTKKNERYTKQIKYR